MGSKMDKLHTLQISTLESLQQSLAELRKNNGSQPYYMALAVNNPEIKVCPFQLEQVDKKEIKNRLIMEAVEHLSLPADVIGLDYQIFESSQDHIRGVFVCYPKELLQQYISTLDHNRCIPVKIIPSILAGIDSFLDQYKGSKGRLCFFDFSRDNIIYFAVFTNGHCDYLREIFYENGDEVEHEVVQSLRSACAISTIKRFDQIYFSGKLPNKTKVIERVKDLFCKDVTHGYFTDVEASLRREDNVIALNLIKEKTFSLNQRKNIKRTTQAVLCASCLFIAVFGIMILIAELKIKKLQSYKAQSDFSYAKELEQRLEAL